MHLAIDRCLHTWSEFIEGQDDPFVAFFSKHGVEIDDRTVHFRVHIDSGNGHKVKAFIINTSQLVANDLTQHLGETCGTGVPMR